MHDVEHAATARDLEHIVEDSRESGDLPAELSMLLDRILDFPNRDAEHAMIPRPRVDTVVDTDTLGHLRGLMAHGHSRYPVLADDTHDVVGVVHLVDLLVTAGARHRAGDRHRPAAAGRLDLQPAARRAARSSPRPATGWPASSTSTAASPA